MANQVGGSTKDDQRCCDATVDNVFLESYTQQLCFTSLTFEGLQLIEWLLAPSFTASYTKAEPKLASDGPSRWLHSERSAVKMGQSTSRMKFEHV